MGRSGGARRLLILRSAGAYSWVHTDGSRITDLIGCSVPTFGQILNWVRVWCRRIAGRGGIVLVLLLRDGSGSQQKGRRECHFSKHWSSSLGPSMSVKSIIARAGASFRT